MEKERDTRYCWYCERYADGRSAMVLTTFGWEYETVCADCRSDDAEAFAWRAEGGR